ncbi:hypothetical protein PPACK8108_LOCUS13162 [Phakopsora pachyrhizi]|uniref:Uncharacterized protein n=1 Tax=Phakopsora pachyrhizi TaxID=170000 RepID=A0AAV0B552_PHAPC|nr:hypothetical protein PPACK8108_LOCUS13162 [Phakopsora pachyrhizi]
MSFNKPDSSSSSLGSRAYGLPMKLDTLFKHLTSLISDPGPRSLQQQSQPTNSNSTMASTIASGPKAVRLVKLSKLLTSLKTTSSLLLKLKSNEETELITTKASNDYLGSTKQSGERKVGGLPNSQRLSRRSESANGMISYLGPPSLNQTSRCPTSTIGAASTVCGSGSSGGSELFESGSKTEAPRLTPQRISDRVSVAETPKGLKLGNFGAKAKRFIGGDLSDLLISANGKAEPEDEGVLMNELGSNKFAK